MALVFKYLAEHGIVNGFVFATVFLYVYRREQLKQNGSIHPDQISLQQIREESILFKGKSGLSMFEWYSISFQLHK